MDTFIPDDKFVTFYGREITIQNVVLLVLIVKIKIVNNSLTCI